MTDKQILKWLDQLQGELDTLKKKSGGGGGGGGYTKTVIYDSGSQTEAAPMNTDVELSRPVTDFDCLLVVFSTPGDQGISAFESTVFIDVEEAVYNLIIINGYLKRSLSFDARNISTFKYTSYAVDEGSSYAYAIYKVFGIKF